MFQSTVDFFELEKSGVLQASAAFACSSYTFAGLARCLWGFIDSYRELECNLQGTAVGREP